jgi:hypothetical protein
LKTLIKATFLKGYQWPFDPRKIRDFGSSLIDLLVYREINEKGRKVFIDYTKNPSSKSGESFSLENLDPVVETYLNNSCALKPTPIERLRALNPKAIDLYQENGIDISKELLQVAVCVQHNNGGLKGNIWWESDLRHLFPVGEVNGSHGVYRPGGSALNSGQVGSFRAALYITKKYNMAPPEPKAFITESKKQICDVLFLSKRWMSSGSTSNNIKYLSEIRKRMSETGGIFREKEKVANACAEASSLLSRLSENIGASSVPELADSFLLMDHCITHFVYLESIRYYLENGGRSRGSYIVENTKNLTQTPTAELTLDTVLCMFDRDIENKIIEVGLCDEEVRIKLEEVRKIPKQNLWFESVWKEYLEDNYLDC